MVCGVDVVKDPRAAIKKSKPVMVGNWGFDVEAYREADSLILRRFVRSAS